MAINDQIAAGVKPIQIENPLNNMAKFYNIRNDMQTNQMNQMTMAEAERKQGQAAQYRNALSNLGDPSSEGYEERRAQAYYNNADPAGYQAIRTSELANQKTQGDIQKQKEELGAQTSRDLSRSSTDANVTAWFEDAMNSRLFNPDEKVKITNEYGRVMAIPVGEERAAYLRSKGQSAAEAKSSTIQQDVGGSTNIVSIPASGGAPTVLSSTKKTLNPEQALGVPVGYDEGSASLDARNKNLDAKLVELNNPKTTPERAKALEGEIQQDRRSLSVQQQDQESMRRAAQQAKQPLDAKERLLANYYAGIAAGRSPKDPEMMDMMAQIVHNRSFAPPARTDIKVNSYMPASEEAQKDYVKGARVTYDQLKNAKGTINSIDKAIALVPSSAQFMGPGGEPLLNATSFLNNRLGLNIDTKGITDATELRTRIFFNIMDNLKKMDAQPSQLQQEIMQQALGTLGTDPKALPNVLKAFQDVIRGKVEDYNKDVTDAESRGVKFPYKPQIDLGASSGRMPPTSGAVAYLKANPGMRADFEAKFGPGSADKVLGKGK